MWSIVIASALVVTITLSIALPLALRHKHKYSEDWSTDASYHWHACTGKKCDEITDKAGHTFVDKNNTTQYWMECSVCGYQQEKIEAKVEASVISNALQLKDAGGNEYTNWQAEKLDNLAGNVTVKTKFTGASFYAYSVSGTETEEEIVVNFTQNDAPKHSVYQKDNTTGKWNKATNDGVYSDMHHSAKYNTFGHDLNNVLTSTFDYDEETNTYSNTRTVDIGDAELSVSETTTLKFANGKLVSIHIVRTTTVVDTNVASITKDITWTISYGNVVIDLPAGDQTTHVHTYSSNWSVDATHHWHACMDDDCNSVSDKAGHSFGADGNKIDDLTIPKLTVPTEPTDPTDPVTPTDPTEPTDPTKPSEEEKKSLSGGAIAGIVIGSVAVAGIGGFAIFWFVIKKKKWTDLVAIFKKLFKKNQIKHYKTQKVVGNKLTTFLCKMTRGKLGISRLRFAPLEMTQKWCIVSI